MQVLKARPKSADVFHLLGLIAYRTGDHGRAADLFAKAILEGPTTALFYNSLGIVLERMGQAESAVEKYDQAIRIQPANANFYINRGNALARLGRWDDAIESYDRGISIAPGAAQAHINRGAALRALNQLEQAVASYDRAIDLAPNTARAHYNRANALRDLARLDAALESYDRAIAIDPRDPQLHVNRGITLKQLNRLDAAIASYDKALEVQPNYSEAVWNKALAQLLMGDFEQGWKSYEWRWETAQKGFGRTYRQPRWLGADSLQNKTIFIHAEQGLGDTIQFSRYVSLLAERGADVVLEVPTALTALLSTLDGAARIISPGDDPLEFDYYCPLLTLPLAFGTGSQNIPASPAYLRGDPGTVRQWAQKLGERTAPRVGIVWSGNADTPDDRNRSIALLHLLKTLPQGCEYISLQKEVRPADRDALRASPLLRHFGDQLNDFSDTAALCTLVDVVVTVDTSVAHLAGALGIRTSILLPYSPDWRWLLARDDSPWYPSVKLYRQVAVGDWSAPLLSVGVDLQRRFFGADNRDDSRR